MGVYHPHAMTYQESVGSQSCTHNSRILGNIQGRVDVGVERFGCFWYIRVSSECGKGSSEVNDEMLYRLDELNAYRSQGGRLTSVMRQKVRSIVE